MYNHVKPRDLAVCGRVVPTKMRTKYSRYSKATIFQGQFSRSSKSGVSRLKRSVDYWILVVILQAVSYCLANFRSVRWLGSKNCKGIYVQNPWSYMGSSSIAISRFSEWRNSLGEIELWVNTTGVFSRKYVVIRMIGSTEFPFTLVRVEIGAINQKQYGIFLQYKDGY